MERVSSNLTLFYKIFIPVFWIVFFGAFSIALLLEPSELGGDSGSWSLRIGLGFFFITGFATLYFTLMQFKRVEIGAEFVYVTNYFQNVRYPLHNIERIETSTFLFFSVASIYLKVPGRFGKKILFTPAMSRLKAALEKNPALKSIWNAS